MAEPDESLRLIASAAAEGALDALNRQAPIDVEILQPRLREAYLFGYDGYKRTEASRIAANPALSVVEGYTDGAG